MSAPAGWRQGNGDGNSCEDGVNGEGDVGEFNLGDGDPEILAAVEIMLWFAGREIFPRFSFAAFFFLLHIFVEIVGAT